MLDASGVITHFVAVKEDITDLRKAEEARGKLEEQLRHSQKLDALGRLAGGVAHDFNNLLCVIVGCGELMQARFPPDDPNRMDLAEILRAAESSDPAVSVAPHLQSPRARQAEARLDQSSSSRA